MILPNFKPSYKILHKDEQIEVRKYPPHRRSIQIYGGNSFFLPFPYVVYFGVGVKPPDGLQELYKGFAYKGFKGFAVAFANEEDEFVYATPFSSIGEMICVNNRHHLAFSKKTDLSKIVSEFWSTEFYTPYNILSIFGVGTFREWGKLTPDQVVHRLSYGKHSLKDAMDRCHKNVQSTLVPWLEDMLRYATFSEKRGFF